MLRHAADRKKRQVPEGLALFLCLAVTACSPPEAANACTADTANLEKHRVEAVVDGDTLRLAGGKKLRLIGINTPELGRGESADEPGAQAARDMMQQLAGRPGVVWLQDGKDDRDHHGRRLAHAFDAGGNSLSGQLLQRGLGFHVAISPNFAYADCLQAAEAGARDAGRGVWAESVFGPLAAADLQRSQSGFVRIRDQVTRVSFKDNGWWLQLGGKVGVRVKAADQPLFSRRGLSRLEGQEVEVRGWLMPRDGGWWSLSLGHPSMLQSDF